VCQRFAAGAFPAGHDAAEPGALLHERRIVRFAKAPLPTAGTLTKLRQGPEGVVHRFGCVDGERRPLPTDLGVSKRAKLSTLEDLRAPDYRNHRSRISEGHTAGDDELRRISSVALSASTVHRTVPRPAGTRSRGHDHREQLTTALRRYPLRRVRRTATMNRLPRIIGNANAEIVGVV
jgi:hypothetical protein